MPVSASLMTNVGRAFSHAATVVVPVVVTVMVAGAVVMVAWVTPTHEQAEM